MKFSSLLIASTFLALGASASAQTVTETRTFTQEYFDTGTGSAANWLPNFDLGLQGPTSYTHGQINSFDVQITATWNISMLVVNGWTGATEFEWLNSMNLSPRVGDCSPYDQRGINATTGVIQPGQPGLLQYNGVHQYGRSGSSFHPACGNNVWPWTDLHLWHGSVSLPYLFSYGGGFPVPSSWVRIQNFGATIDGHFTVEWTPDHLPFTSACPGNSTSGANLIAGGAYDNLWLMQTGAPDTLNLLLQSDAASTVVPSNGFCIGGGTAVVFRLHESLSFGGEPYRLPYIPALAGRTQYFQAWFRTANGGAETGECIGVTFP